MDSDELFLTHFIFALIHFVWFVVYYSRFSTLNQKLQRISRMQQRRIITDELAKSTVASTAKKIRFMKRICLFPNPLIAVAHCIYLETLPLRATDEYLIVAGILLGGIALILMANVAKGRMIIDPNRRFTGNSFD